MQSGNPAASNRGRISKTADYSRNFDEELKKIFDVRQSMAFDMRSKADALSIEQFIKRTYSGNKVCSPYDEGKIPFGSGGHTEWFNYSIYQDVIDYLFNYGRGITLEKGMRWSNDFCSENAATS